MIVVVRPRALGRMRLGGKNSRVKRRAKKKKTPSTSTSASTSTTGPSGAQRHRAVEKAAVRSKKRSTRGGRRARRVHGPSRLAGDGKEKENQCGSSERRPPLPPGRTITSTHTRFDEDGGYEWNKEVLSQSEKKRKPRGLSTKWAPARHPQPGLLDLLRAPVPISARPDYDLPDRPLASSSSTGLRQDAYTPNAPCPIHEDGHSEPPPRSIKLPPPSRRPPVWAQVGDYLLHR